MTNIYFAGIDIGSTMTKVVIINDDAETCASVIQHTGAEHRRLANKVMEEALEQSGLAFDEISYVIATGYGRINVPFADRQITELTCHARGVAGFFPIKPELFYGFLSGLAFQGIYCYGDWHRTVKRKIVLPTLEQQMSLAAESDPEALDHYR